MKTVTLRPPFHAVFIALCYAVLIVLGYFVVLNFRADLYYWNALFLEKPSLPFQRSKYYRDTNSLLDKAIHLIPDSADYYSLKADMFVAAIEEGLQEELDVEAVDAERLYLAAIRINPFSFTPRLALALFYLQQNNDKAEEALQIARQFCPTDYRSYTFLSIYYFKHERAIEGFHNLLMATHYAFKPQVMDERNKIRYLLLQSNLPQLRDFSIQQPWSYRAVYTVRPATFAFDFKKHGFPAAQLQLFLTVYTTQPVTGVSLYKGRDYYAAFVEQGSVDGYFVYGLQLDRSDDYALDDLTVQTSDYSDIGKLEIAIRLP